MNPRVNNITIVAAINNFGQEDVSYITEDRKHACLLKRSDGILDAICDVHFNSEHPENANVRLRSLKNNLAEVRRNGEWTTELLDGVLQSLVWNGYVLVARRYLNDESYRTDVIKNNDKIDEWCLMYGKNEKQLKERLKVRLIIDRDKMKLHGPKLNPRV